MVDFWFTHPDGHKERFRKLSPVQTKRGAEQYEREVRQALLDGSYGKEKEVESPIAICLLSPRLGPERRNAKGCRLAITKLCAFRLDVPELEPPLRPRFALPRKFVLSAINGCFAPPFADPQHGIIEQRIHDRRGQQC